MNRPPIAETLLSLLRSGPMPPETLRDLGEMSGNRHAVNVAIERLRAAGLVEVQARLTRAGRRAASRRER